MARYACQWLDERGKLWPFYRAWRDGVRDDPSGEKAFERIVGMTQAEMARCSSSGVSSSEVRGRFVQGCLGVARES